MGPHPMTQDSLVITRLKMIFLHYHIIWVSNPYHDAVGRGTLLLQIDVLRNQA